MDIEEMTNYNTDNYLCSPETATEIDAEIDRLKKKVDRYGQGRIIKDNPCKSGYVCADDYSVLLEKLRVAEAEIKWRKKQMEDLWRLDHHVQCGRDRNDVMTDYDIIEVWFDSDGNVLPY